MINRKLMALAASNLFESEATINGNQVNGASLVDSVNSKRCMRGNNFMSPNGPFNLNSLRFELI